MIAYLSPISHDTDVISTFTGFNLGGGREGAFVPPWKFWYKFLNPTCN